MVTCPILTSFIAKGLEEIPSVKLANNSLDFSGS